MPTIITRNTLQFPSPASTGAGGSLLMDNFGQLSRRVQNGSCNVNDFDADPTGAASADAAFAAALVAIEAAKVSSPYYDSGFRGFIPSLYLKSGSRYRLTSPNALTPTLTTGDVSLRGLVITSDGPESAEIICDWNTDEWLCDNQDLFAFSAIRNVRFVSANRVERGFNLEQPGSGGRVQNFIFEDVAFENFAAAVRLAGAVNVSEVKFNRVKWVVRPGQVGLWMNGNPQAVNIWLRDNEFYVEGGETVLSISDAAATAGTTNLNSPGGTFTAAMADGLHLVTVPGQGTRLITAFDANNVTCDTYWPATFSAEDAVVWKQGVGMLIQAGGKLKLDCANMICMPGGLLTKIVEGGAGDGSLIGTNNGNFEFLAIAPELRAPGDDPANVVATDARTYGRLLELNALATVTMQGNLTTVTSNVLVPDAIRMHRRGHLTIRDSRLSPLLGFKFSGVGGSDYVLPYHLSTLIADSELFGQFYDQLSWDFPTNGEILSAYARAEVRGCWNGSAMEPVDVFLNAHYGNTSLAPGVKVMTWRLAPTTVDDGLPTPTTTAEVKTTGSGTPTVPHMRKVPRGCTVRKFTIIRKALASQSGKAITLEILDKDSNVLCTMAVTDGNVDQTQVSPEIRYLVDSDAKRQFRLRATNPVSGFVTVAGLPGWVEIEWV
jgi:hypothetical protein